MALKLGVWDGFVLPPLGDSAGEPVVGQISAIYHDTPDLRLLRRGVTARIGDDGWTVRWPGRVVTGVDAVALTRGWALGAALVPVARLETTRRTLALDGALVHQDDVSVVRGERVAARFHELEIEAPDAVAEGLRAQLTEAGAQPIDPAPKLARALGPAAVVPWPLEVEPPEPDAAAAEVIRFRLMSNVAELADQHAIVALDGAVRRARRAVRGLRRDLRLFGPLLDGEPPDLKPIASAFGLVRRLDVVLERSSGQRGTEEALELLRAERAAALDALRATEPPFEALAAFAAAPPTTKAARRPAAETLPRLVRKPLTRLRAAAEGETDAVREAAIRLSVAVDAALPYAGRDARRAAARLDALVDALREQRRATIAIRTLRDLPRANPDAAWAAGLLAGLETTRAGEARARAAAVTADALRRKQWSWVPR